MSERNSIKSKVSITASEAQEQRDLLKQIYREKIRSKYGVLDARFVRKGLDMIDQQFRMGRINKQELEKLESEIHKEYEKFKFKGLEVKEEKIVSVKQESEFDYGKKEEKKVVNYEDEKRKYKLENYMKSKIEFNEQIKKQAEQEQREKEQRILKEKDEERKKYALDCKMEKEKQEKIQKEKEKKEKEKLEEWKKEIEKQKVEKIQKKDENKKYEKYEIKNMLEFDLAEAKKIKLNEMQRKAEEVKQGYLKLEDMEYKQKYQQKKSQVEKQYEKIIIQQSIQLQEEQDQKREAEKQARLLKQQAQVDRFKDTVADKQKKEEEKENERLEREIQMKREKEKIELERKEQKKKQQINEMKRVREIQIELTKKKKEVEKITNQGGGSIFGIGNDDQQIKQMEITKKNLETQYQLMKQMNQKESKEDKIKKMSKTELLLNKNKFEMIKNQTGVTLNKIKVDKLERNQLRNFE